MIIDVNPQTITEIAQTIANAYGEVEEAARILTSITEHNNWNCKERDAINDYTQSNAREILKISEKSGNFANVMKTVAENFTTDEKNISEMFTSVESMIGSILSIRAFGNVAAEMDVSDFAVQHVVVDETALGLRARREGFLGCRRAAQAAQQQEEGQKALHGLRLPCQFRPCSPSQLSMFAAISSLFISWNMKWLLPVMPILGRSTTVQSPPSAL